MMSVLKWPSAKTTGRFIPPMLLLRRERLPEGPEWLYELKLDGYRDRQGVGQPPG